jgi:NADPH-dependent glutamate synthase beta subunit-like oxidoreductase/glutamate synthase domain-containing protein 3/NAD-dependent dihydropyrimidine dehydrogenase PreA subunit
MKTDQPYHRISGKENEQRIESRVLEERIQSAVAHGLRHLEIDAYGQHGIGGRLWKTGGETVHIRVTGQSGQRLGAMGFPNTQIKTTGPASDDVGWLNAGAEITVRGNAANGAGNAMAQGKIYVGGNIGARGMAMTKHNPRFDPPQLWVLGSAGDYFGEFMAGGIAVICGVDGQDPDNVLGYRPLVGMVGGRVFLRGPHDGYSQTDAKQVPLSDEDWEWLTANLKRFLDAIHRPELFSTLTQRQAWQLLIAKPPFERGARKLPSMTEFHESVWMREMGKGGLIGDLTDMDMSQIPVITTGHLRRYVPVWENRKYRSPCEAACPTGIPVHERWRLIREGRVDEAVDMALAYTPFPATVCGYLCPNLCMAACTKHAEMMPGVDVTHIGRASMNAKTPKLPDSSGKKVAVIGGGPAGLSVAWQLRLSGHEATVFDMSETLGGKIVSVIPESRVPEEVLAHELKRVGEVIPHVRLQHKLTQTEVNQLKKDFDFVVIAAGAQQPRRLPIPGEKKTVPANDFLARAKKNAIRPGKRLVIIGAGNVGCDAATEAHRLGAENITLIDIQEPASFGRERAAAEAVGARFKWPCFAREITEKGVVLETGELLPADTVVVSIGDAPDLEFLPGSVKTENGYVVVDENLQTTDSQLFAIGDIVRPGLLTDAIGQGRKAAETISAIIAGRRPARDGRLVIDKNRVHLAYFDPRRLGVEALSACGAECASCGACRDCGICEAVCPQTAITRKEKEDGGYEYVVDEARCIGCGFCAGACPCGVWALVENTPL